MWRGSLLPLGCEAAPRRLTRHTAQAGYATASQSSGSKLPRHKGLVATDLFQSCRKRTFAWRP
ncbi:hypothetical protein EAH78_28815 [Pseudomonas arsenicoxydans]|uniref:Uncharacterized protein n=1 Tax=Pseudomonas arsenicoxydans TaxID=702115 RepID=A0A502HCZ6_9PSED|nr:hypothetical protein EAH78_28815 [Pseudomonas arsenicoxydans]